jgi:hypothetical protein
MSLALGARDASCVYVLRVSQPKDLDRVRVFLRGVHLTVEERADGTIEVTAPGAPTALHERREIAGYVTTWNALNPANPIAMDEV